MTQPEKPTPTPEDAWRAHKAAEAAETAVRVERATAAARLTQAFSERVLVLDVAGQRIEARYPGRTHRDELTTILARVRRLLRGDDTDAEDDALQASVARLAAALTLDASLDEAYFTSSEFAMEAALGVLFAIEGALTARAGEASTFRPHP